MIGLVVFVYACAFSLQFIGDYLGRAPVLDGRENLALAVEFAGTGLPDGPLYRAMLYSWVLSLLPVDVERLPQLALLFGVFCHLLSACLVGTIAQRLWQQRSARLLAATLYGVYPVALYFSVQVLDITFSITLFLAGLYCLLAALDIRSGRRSFRRVFLLIGAGALGGLVVLARPNFLPPVLLFPMFPLLFSALRGRRSAPPIDRGIRSCLLVGLALSGVLSAQGLLNYRHCGQFRLLPWQGAYNLYAANRDGANGQFYKQRVSFDQIPAGMNSTRLESEYLYRESHGMDAELDVRAMNAYWRAVVFREVGADPVRWIALMGKKIVYLFNDWEQYNNLTYAYHKERFSLLRWNPLGWGLLCLAALGALMLGGKQLPKDVGLMLMLLFVAYAAGVLLFFVSARFRLPLAPLLCVCAGGLGALRFPQLKQICWRRYACLCTGIFAAGALLYGDWFGAQDDATFIQDELLLANAATRLGEDAAALRFAEAVLGRDGSREEARRIQVASLFNLWLVADTDAVKESLRLRLGSELLVLRSHDASSLFISGVYAWTINDHEGALVSWREAIRRFKSEALFSARALQAVGAGGFFAENDSGVDQLKKILNP